LQKHETCVEAMLYVCDYLPGLCKLNNKVSTEYTKSSIWIWNNICTARECATAIVCCSLEATSFHFFFDVLRYSLGFLALKKSYELPKMSSWCPRLANEVSIQILIKFVLQENMGPQFYIVRWNPSFMSPLHKMK
jgi:hypothetical protein